MKKHSKKSLATALITALLLTQPELGQAIEYTTTWVGNHSSDITANNNWSNTAPVQDADAVFNGIATGNSSPDLASGDTLTTGTILFSADTTVYVDSNTSTGLSVTTTGSLSGNVKVANSVTGTISLGQTNPGLVNVAGYAGNSSSGTTTGTIQYLLNAGSALNLTNGATNGATVTVSMTGGTNTLTITPTGTTSLSSIDSSASSDVITLENAHLFSLTSSGNHTINGGLRGLSGRTLIQNSHGGNGILTLNNSTYNSVNYLGAIQIQSGTINIPNWGALGDGTGSPLAFTGSSAGSTLQWSADDTSNSFPYSVTLDTNGPNTGTLDPNGHLVFLAPGQGIISNNVDNIINIGGPNGGIFVLEGTAAPGDFVNGLVQIIGNTTLQDTGGVSQGMMNADINLVNTGSTVNWKSQDPSYSSILSGPGRVVVNDGSVLSITGGNSVNSGPTYIGQSTPGAIIVESTNSLSPYSAFVLANLADTSLTLTGSNGQIIGSLAGGGTTGGNVILNNASLTLGGDNTSTTFAGLLTGNISSSMTKNGNGTFSISGNNTGFLGLTTINSGELHLNSGSSLGGSVVLSSISSILSGVGTIYGSLTQNGGIVHPGSSPGILTVEGAYAFNIGELYIDINGEGTTPGVNNSELVVNGATTIVHNTNNPATVVVDSADGSFSIAGLYTILNSSGGITGASNLALETINLAFTPVLTYDTDNVYLDFQIPFLEFAEAEGTNAFNVAQQLISITDPTSAETTLLSGLTALPPADIAVALNQMAGSQYVEQQGSVELSTHQFVKRLYDPLRYIASIDPICCAGRCSGEIGLDTWLEASGGRSFFDGNSNAHGFKCNEYAISLGAQTTFCEDWTLGTAFAYEHNTYHFNIGDSSGSNNTYLGAFYGLYRPEGFYVMGDLVFGCSNGKITRTIPIAPLSYTEVGRPKCFQGDLYMEIGLDGVSHGMSLQPFLGLEGGFYTFRAVNENGDAPLALHINRHSYGTLNSHLGIHISSHRLDCGLTIAIDLSWQYRFLQAHNHRTAYFEDFGSTFTVVGAPVNRNAFDGALNLTQDIDDIWTFYATAMVEKWTNANSYSCVAGVSAHW